MAAANRSRNDVPQTRIKESTGALRRQAAGGRRHRYRSPVRCSRDLTPRPADCYRPGQEVRTTYRDQAPPNPRQHSRIVRGRSPGPAIQRPRGRSPQPSTLQNDSEDGPSNLNASTHHAQGRPRQPPHASQPADTRQLRSSSPRRRRNGSCHSSSTSTPFSPRDSNASAQVTARKSRTLRRRLKAMQRS